MAREGGSRLKKIVLLILAVLVAAFIVIQFWRIDTTPIPIVQAETIQAGVTVPPDVDMVLTRSCGDCHTNGTVYPWYSQMQPVAWWLSDHIAEGRGELNFSKFNTYPARKKKKKLEEICDQIKQGEMPLFSYTIVHRNAVLSESEKTAICNWTEAAAAAIQE
jgi:hypothetical protein